MTRNSPSCSRSRPISRTGSSARPQTTLLYARLICAHRRGARNCGLSTATGWPASSSRRPALRRIPANCRRRCARFVDLLQEADQFAADSGKEVVGEAEVQAAIDAQFRRGDRIYRRLQEEIGRKTIHIETDGAQIGQVNGLSVISLGDTRLRHPEPDYGASAARPRRSRRYRARGRAWRAAPFKGCADPLAAFSAAASAIAGRCR